MHCPTSLKERGKCPFYILPNDPRYAMWSLHFQIGAIKILKSTLIITRLVVSIKH